jgi:CRP-like cAMP-binding protein
MQNMNRILAARLQELEERFREVATEAVASRLGLALLRLSKQVGKSTSEGVQISLTREELAQMIGTTLCTVSRVLSRWAQTSYVIPCREAVYLVDPKKLKSAVEDRD